jgi:hypothetical protein
VKNVSEPSFTEPKWWLPTSEFTALYGRNLTEMGLDCKIISMVATQFSKKVGYKLPLGE